ncbi:MAG TPA: T9SS type A sorting domain-containing protein [Saprospiraceae bacterium]|nr:T9SS type A sorting domain-containing protein [Saprospiraceae bacterium]
MKFFLFIFTVVISVTNGYNQINCTAPDSIIEKYKDDADLLALRRIQSLQSTYKDSIEIPRIVSDTFLNALIAVYNATHLPERDTVIEILDIHTSPSAYIDRIVVAADSNLSWMKLLRQNLIPTGYAPLDSMIDKYDLSVDGYENWSNWFFWHTVTLKSTRNFNIPNLAEAFNTLSEIYFAEHKVIYGDGNEINDDGVIVIDPFPIVPSVSLFYSHGWGDCQSGCIEHRTWWFKIYEGCAVEFVDVFGSPLPFTALNDLQHNPISVYPNPFDNEIRIDGISNPFEFSISNLNGHKIFEGKSNGMNISGLENLHPGFYILTIKANDRFSTYKVIKSQ